MLDIAGLRIPSYMQGKSFRRSLQGTTPEGWDQLAYHRYWMHRDVIHNSYAHYGVRDERWKLIYWYNLGLNNTGAQAGGEDQEWELFDTHEDPLELFNVYDEPSYADVVTTMTRKLENKMLDIGDIWVHDVSPDEARNTEDRRISEELKKAKRDAVNH